MIKLQTYTTKEVKDFPKLMISVTGIIVFFKNKNSGMVLEGDNITPTGEYLKDWDDSAFTDFNEKITIQNI